MTITIDQLADALQTLFTTAADQAAKDSGMIRRQRKLTGAQFVQALVFHWLENPDATIEEIIEDLDIGEAAFNERFNDRAADCLRRVLEQALNLLFAARDDSAVAPLRDRFRRGRYHRRVAGRIGRVLPRLWWLRSPRRSSGLEAPDAVGCNHRPLGDSATGTGARF